jgi:luciferase family oxidoreductase group 1
MNRLSILDLGHRAPGQLVTDHLQEIVRSARLADELGFARYWLAEHHAATSSSVSPTVLAAAIAQATRTIRVGSAGVLLNAYNPFRLACDFALLSQLFPDRVDLGIARAWPGANGYALLDVPCPTLPMPAGPGQADDARVAQFAERLSDLVAHLDASLPVEHRHFGAVVVPPVRRSGLEVWLLGSQDTSANLASQRGMSLALALFLSPRARAEIVARYRAEFRPGWSSTPWVALAVAGVCAATDDEAAKLVARRPSAHVHVSVVGSPARCREQLAALAEQFGTDELVWVDLAPDFERRRESLRLLARGA